LKRLEDERLESLREAERKAWQQGEEELRWLEDFYTDRDDPFAEEDYRQSLGDYYGRLDDEDDNDLDWWYYGY
jgi:hypothetical protein